MTRRTPFWRRLGIRPRTCPPLELAHSQDPGYALKPGLFLGLFDVSHRRAVVGGVGVPGVWREQGPKLSKTGPKHGHKRL